MCCIQNDSEKVLHKVFGRKCAHMRGNEYKLDVS